jgi:hypothetical protein
MTGFDAAYYRRFYESVKTRVQGPREVARLAEMVVRIIEHAGGRIGNALDVGAGTGLWRDWFAKRAPNVRYRSTDVSDYACERYGHELRDISVWRARERFDLIICQGVLPYLDDRSASRAIENIAHMSRGFLYLEAITAEDLGSVCDLEATDLEINRRPGAWYRRRLNKHFAMIGAGVWIRRGAPHRLYSLERAP